MHHQKKTITFITKPPGFTGNCSNTQNPSFSKTSKLEYN